MRLATLLAVAFVVNAHASDVQYTNLEFRDGVFNYEFAVDIEAPFAAVHRVITNYAAFDRLNDNVVKSEILETYDEHALKRRLWLNYCLLFFCFDLFFVENVTEVNLGVIESTILPMESNFRGGFMTWRFESTGPHTTRVMVAANQEPDFWIPPIIGPMLFKRALAKEVRRTGINIEREAQNVVFE